MQRFFLGTCCLMAGCFYPADRGRVLEARLEKLSASNEEMTAEMRRYEERVLVRMEEKVANMQKTLAGLDRTSRRSDADTGILLQKTVEEVAALRGQVETFLHKSEQLEAQLARLEEETKKKLADLNAAQLAVTAEAARRTAEEVRRPENKKEFLALADSKMQAGDDEVARQLYGEFLKKWEKDALAGEAHFALGELWFKDSKWREAIFEYGKVIQEFPQSRSAAMAYLRSSTCFKTLKMESESRLALEELVRLYPKSEAAKSARIELASMGKGPARSKGKK